MTDGSRPTGDVHLRAMRRLLLTLIAGAALAAGCDDGGGLDTARGRLAFAPASLDFGEVPVGGVGAQRLAITALDVAVDDVTFAIEAPFEITGAPPTRIERSGTTVDLAFRPTAGGTFDGDLVVTAGGETYRVPLTGRGASTGLRLVYDGPTCADGGVSFGAVPRFQEVRRTFAVEATGNLTADVVGVYLEPGMSADVGIVSPREQRHVLAPGERLDVVVVYFPSDNGADEALLTFELANGATYQVPLCGLGAAVSICIEPNPLALDAAPIDATARGTFTVRSCNDEPLVVTSVIIIDDAAHPSDEGFGVVVPDRLSTPLPTNATVDIGVTFTAATVGEAEAWVRVESNDPLMPSSFVRVTAEAKPPCQLRVAPDRISFSNVPVGSTEVRRALLFNDNPRECAIVRTGIAGVDAASFSIETSSTTTLAPGEALLIPITYTPTTDTRVETAQLEVVTGDDFTSSVSLFGAAFLDPGCHLDIRPNALAFGAVDVGVLHARNVTVRNLSPVTCEIVSASWLAGSSPAFTVGTPMPLVLGPRETRTLAVQIDAATTGAHAGTLHLDTTDIDESTLDVAVHALAREAGICVQPDRLDFGTTNLPQMQSVTISACGADDLDLTSIAFQVPVDAELSIVGLPALPTTLAAGDTLVVDVRYAPADAFADWGVLRIDSSDVLRPSVSVPVRGGPSEFPPETGENLYVWQQQAIMRFPLQGGLPGAPFFGPAASPSHGCAGCHAVSPDGRYVALIEYPDLVLVDTTTNVEISTGITASVESVSWNPDINTTPPYQFVYASGEGPLSTASVSGPIGPLPGTTDAFVYKMPSWGPTGQIAAARAPSAAATTEFSFVGPVDVVIVPEAGGAPVPLAGASADSAAHYYPAWSPTGTWIALTFSPSAATTYAAADAQIRLVRADGSGTVSDLALANDLNAASSYPTWSLDGRILSFSSNRTGGVGDWDVYATFVDDANGATSAAQIIQNVNTPSFDHVAVWAR